jgi:hypothetical protein
MGDEAIEELFVLTARVGKDNVKVLIAPRDFRRQPPDMFADASLPTWTPELYDTIAREMQVFSSKVKLSNAPASRAHP